MLRSNQRWGPLILLGIACRTPPRAETGGPPGLVQRVIVVVLDGVRVEDGFHDGGVTLDGTPGAELMPRIRALGEQGLKLEAAYNFGVPITLESHVELTTGLRQPLGTSGPGQTGWFRSAVPTLFERARAEYGWSDRQVLVVENTIILGELGYGLHPDGGFWRGAEVVELKVPNDEPAALDSEVLDIVAQRVIDEDARVVVANLHRADIWGHQDNVDGYLARVREQDAAVGALWDQLEQAGVLDSTLLVVMANHGRHIESWAGHGDQCGGCRAIPLWVWGPGITPGQRSNEPVDLADLGVSLAASLALDLPHSRGASIDAIVGESPSFEGARDLAASGGVVATAGRSAAGPWLLVDGQSLAVDGALRIEAPVVATSGALAAVCARVLAGQLPATTWRGHCWVREETGWVDEGFPADMVSPFFEPALQWDETGRLWVAWADNPYGWAMTPGVKITRWQGEWQTAKSSSGSVVYPGRPTLLLDGDSTLVASAISTDESEPRDTRRVRVWRFSEEGEWDTLQTLDPGGTYPRHERPALVRATTGVELAWLAHGPDVRTRVLRTRVDDWGIDELDAGDTLLPHVGPHHAGAWTWARKDPELRVCQVAGCQALEAESLLDMTGDTELLLLTEQGQSQWN